jgi:hypothetical protein
MATLNLTAKEFSDIAMIWLFDQVMNPEQIQNEAFKDFVQKHSSKIKTPLMKYYLDSRGETRINYKRIKGVFSGDNKAIQQIRIGPDEKIEQIKKGKEGIIKKVLKKVLLKQSLSIEDEQVLKEMRDEF